MRKIGFFNIGKLGLVKSAGTGKTDINKVIEKWIPKHMVFWYDVQKQGATNEILKANPYLQDHSGNNRPLKLNNFLFAAMSGVGGYTDNFNDWTINSKKATVKLESSSSVTIQAITQEHIGVVYKYENGKRTIIKVNITGITEEIKGKFAFGYADVTENHNIILENGYFEFDTDKYEGIVGWYGFKSIVPINICNITIEQIPVYPNALVTDGVDDYGVVENLQQGVKVLFMTAIPLGLYKTWYAQDSFSIYGQPGITAYNFRNTGGVTYLDGILNEAEVSNNLLNKKQIVTIVNPTDGGNNSIMFFNSYNSSYMNMAFYSSFGFDSVPTKQNDGFTEQDLIDYYIPKAIVTITVVDVSGSSIQDATVTVGGVQYKTLSDGTVKVRGMVNSTMSLSVKKDGYMPFSDNSWKFADSRITLEVLRNTVITENGYSILLENDGLILTE